MLLSQAPNDPQNINVVTTDPNFTPLQGIFPSQYLKTGLNVLLGIVGVASFVFLIWGGLQFISSSGDKDALEKAKKRIVFALFGLIIAFSSYVAIYAVRALFNVNLIEFRLSPLGTIDPTPMANPCEVYGGLGCACGYDGSWAPPGTIARRGLDCQFCNPLTLHWDNIMGGCEPIICYPACF